MSLKGWGLGYSESPERAAGRRPSGGQGAKHTVHAATIVAYTSLHLCHGAGIACWSSAGLVIERL